MLSEFGQKLGKKRIHNSVIVQHSGSWSKVENQPNLAQVDNTLDGHVLLGWLIVCSMGFVNRIQNRAYHLGKFFLTGGGKF
jgi:hypothetical protein